MAQLPASQYESLLKTDLQCWRCESPQKNIPTLKAHLQKEWEDEKAKALTTKKRKRDQQGDPVTVGSRTEIDQNRQKKQRVDGTGEDSEAVDP
jgi:aprataxin